MGGHHHHHHPSPLQERSAETQRVTLIGALVNLLLTVAKLVAGTLANSAALVADGIHSLSDLISDAMVWIAAHHAGHEPDDEHPYGHGRFETAATLGLGILLVLVALGIVWDAVGGAFNHEQPVPGTLALWVTVFSILSKEAMYWYTIAVANRIRSEMLRANAWHHRTDAISSVVVLIGLGGTMLGWAYLDSVAAVIVGAMVAKIGWDLGWDAMQELVDTSLDEDTVSQAQEVIRSIDGVRSVHMLRTRRHGHEAAADVHVQVAPRLSVSEGHMISQAVEDRLKEQVDAITDVTVHIDPEDDEQAPPCRGLPLRKEALSQLHAQWDGMDLTDTHLVRLHYLSGRIDVELVLPIAEYGDQQAAQALQQRLQQSLDDLPAFGRLSILYAN